MHDEEFFKDRPARFDTQSVEHTGLEPGQKYWAKRNGPGVVLTCMFVNEERGYVVPLENNYAYSLHECFRELSKAPAPA